MDGLTRPSGAAFDPMYWLCRCEGFNVESPDGSVGVVEKVRLWRGPDEQHALVVRTPLFGGGVLTVPVDEVEHVFPRERRITLSVSPLAELAERLLLQEPRRARRPAEATVSLVP